jgi:hypothetical protein
MDSSADDRAAGRLYEAPGLGELLGRQAGILASNEGGVTFSGGEPTAKAPGTGTSGSTVRPRQRG